MQVKSGHYVRVAPDPLPEPEMVIFSDEMAAALGLSKMVSKTRSHVLDPRPQNP